MKAKGSARRKAEQHLPPAPPGCEEDLRELLCLLYGAPPRTLREDPLLPTIHRIAGSVLARERACREAAGAAPALAALRNAIGAVRRLEHAANAIPPPLDNIIIHRLRLAGFQSDALACLSTVFEETEAWAREKMTGSPNGSLTMGPGSVVARLDGDGADQIIGESLALFKTFRSQGDITADPSGDFTSFISTFWRFTTGEDEVPNLPRRVRRVLLQHDKHRREAPLNMEQAAMPGAGCGTPLG